MRLVVNLSFRIGVIGSSASIPRHEALAYEVGKLIAEKGWVLICGGLSGVMEAACRGALEKGGLTVGIIPSDGEDANPYVKIPVITGIGYARNIIIVKSSQALIAIGGEFGTLSEIAIALKLKKPVIGLETWDIKGILKAATPEEAIQMVEIALIER
ncbi:MAG: TIGR00725 family protein [Methanocellales archaeon]